MMNNNMENLNELPEIAPEVIGTQTHDDSGSGHPLEQVAAWNRAQDIQSEYPDADQIFRYDGYNLHLPGALWTNHWDMWSPKNHGYTFGPNNEIVMQFADDPSDGQDYRERVQMLPHFDRTQDPTIAEVKRNKEMYIEQMMRAMWNLQDIHDSPTAPEPKLFNPMEHNYQHGFDIESTCRAIFRELIFRCEHGYRGSQHFNLAAKPKQLFEADRDGNCQTRIENVISILNKSKRVCKDCLTEQAKIVQFVNAPLGSFGKKAKNNGGNETQRKKLEEHAQRKKAAEQLKLVPYKSPFEHQQQPSAQIQLQRLPPPPVDPSHDLAPKPPQGWEFPFGPQQQDAYVPPPRPQTGMVSHDTDGALTNPFDVRARSESPRIAPWHDPLGSDIDAGQFLTSPSSVQQDLSGDIDFSEYLEGPWGSPELHYDDPIPIDDLELPDLTVVDSNDPLSGTNHTIYAAQEHNFTDLRSGEGQSPSHKRARIEPESEPRNDGGVEPEQ